MLNCRIRYRMADEKILDIKELMERTGLSRNAVNKLFHNEKLKTIKLETLMKICDAFDCKLSELIEYEPEQD